MEYLLSVLVPSIRPNNLQRLYESIERSFFGSFEMIVIGPYPLPDVLKDKKNIKWIEDFGSPIRAQQIGLNHVRGVFVSWAADDGFFLDNALTIAFNKFFEGVIDAAVAKNHEVILKAMDWHDSPGIAFDYKKLVMGKYQEGPRLNDGMEKDWYYILSNHESMKMPGVIKGFYMLNVGLVPTKLLLEVGGWDAASFEVCPMAYNDCALRLQNFGVEFLIQDEMMFSCSHLPGLSGDHGPIHNAQTYHDEPLFKTIYKDHAVTRIFIDLDNWKQAPDRWQRRFGK